MKKVFLSTLALVLAANMFGITYTTKATITLYDGTYYPSLVVGESDELADGLTSGYYAPVVDLAEKPLCIYAIYSDTEYESLQMNSLTGLPLGIKTSSATSYTLYFAGVTGTVRIGDLKTGDTFLADAGVPHEFTIEASERNSYINDRFVCFIDVPSGNLETCFTGTELQITNNPFFGPIVVTPKSGGSSTSFPYGTNPVDLSNAGDFPDGDYTIQVGSGANIRKFIVTVKH